MDVDVRVDVDVDVRVVWDVDVRVDEDVRVDVRVDVDVDVDVRERVEGVRERVEGVRVAASHENAQLKSKQRRPQKKKTYRNGSNAIKSTRDFCRST